MFWKNPKRCSSGSHRKGSKCVRNKPKSNGKGADSPNSCKIDGKHYCDKNDKSLRPIIARAGGKSQIAQKIIDKAPPHKVYVEPFVGGGAVVLKKPLAEKTVINDKDKDVMEVYKAFKNGSGLNKCDMTPSRKKFDRVKNKSKKSACDVAYLNKLSFGSNNRNFGGEKKYHKKSKEVGIKYQKQHQKDYKDKLKNTKILSQDFEAVMKNNDSKDTFHYLDPPYVGSEKVYKENDSVTPERVCSVSKKMKGKVMISYNNHPKVRNACKGLKISKINTRYTLGADSNNKKGSEVLITNY